MFKKFFLVLVLFVAGFLALVAMQPSDYRVERTATIAAPADKVFSRVNNLRSWEAWSPWAKLDPAAKATFEGPQEGQGAIMKWQGNEKVGEGAMTLVESEPGQRVGVKVDFVKPFEGTSRSDFSFKPDGQGTAVTWAMSGQHNFIGKAMCLVMNGQKMLGDEIDKAWRT